MKLSCHPVWLSAIVVFISSVATPAWAVDSPAFVGNDAAQAYAAYQTPPDKNKAQFGGSCFLEVGTPIQSLNESECLPKKGAKRTAIIWGDSSIAMYAADLKAYFARAGYSMGQLTSSACPPVANFHESTRPLCESINDRFFELILREKPSIVVMGYAFNGYDFTPTELAATLNNIKLNGSKVVILGTAPFFDTEARLIMADRARRNDPSVTLDPSQNRSFQQIQDVEKSVKRTIATAATGVRYVSVFSVVCPKQTCALAADGMLLYFDQLHVTPLGSSENIKQLFPLIVN